MFTRKIYAIVLPALAALVLGSCTERSLDTFGGERYIHFSENSSFEYRFTFATTPGKTEHVLEIPVEFIGKTIDEDLEYNIEVVTSGEYATTAPSANYKVDGTQIFHKGQFKDTLRVTLTDSQQLSQEKLLAIRVVENDNFKKGPEANSIARIYFSNIISKPAWWDASITSSFLGEYSDIKYQYFIVATGLTEISGLSTDEFKAYVGAYVYYLRDLDAKGTPLYEADGKTKVLATIPYAKLV